MSNKSTVQLNIQSLSPILRKLTKYASFGGVLVLEVEGKPEIAIAIAPRIGMNGNTEPNQLTDWDFYSLPLEDAKGLRDCLKEAIGQTEAFINNAN